MVNEKKQITLEEVKKRNKPDDLWVVIHNKVYDLTKFRHEHPGGEEVLDDSAGKNATKDFDEAGHSNDAKILMKNYYIGDLAESDRPKGCEKCKNIGLIVGAVIMGFATAYFIRRLISSRN